MTESRRYEIACGTQGKTPKEHGKKLKESGEKLKESGKKAYRTTRTP
eukprot:COSAG01_NODE_45023_length_413_cov_1.130573_1_plen_46_part_10